MRIKIVFAFVLLFQALPAFAYIGPGSGISLLSGLWGVLVAIVLAVGAVLIWPIRYLFRRMRRKVSGAPPTPSESAASAEEPAAASEVAESADADHRSTPPPE